MTKRKKLMDVVFILDRSGSMRGTENDTIGGYNGYINDFKSKNAKITTVLFDDKYEMITKRQNVNEVPELTECTFYYMNLVTSARLQRNPTVKEETKLRKFENSIPVGFLIYPISQTADITAFRANIVPVGEDQLPMLEQAREIVRSFNKIYGETLVEPNALLPENKTCLRLPGIDGKAKMSKSLGNCIYLADTKEEVAAKIKKMYTDPEHIQITDKGHLEGNVVFIYLDAFCTKEHFKKYLPEYNNLDELKKHYTDGGLGDGKIKKFLNEVLEEFLSPIREKRRELEQHKDEIYQMLFDGSDEARKEAQKTLNSIKDSMGINYRKEI